MNVLLAKKNCGEDKSIDEETLPNLALQNINESEKEESVAGAPMFP